MQHSRRSTLPALKPSSRQHLKENKTLWITGAEASPSAGLAAHVLVSPDQVQGKEQDGCKEECVPLASWDALIGTGRRMH